MKLKAHFGVEASAVYSIYKNGELVSKSKNLITNKGIENFRDIISGFSDIIVGTGNTPPSLGDTSLGYALDSALSTVVSGSVNWSNTGNSAKVTKRLKGRFKNLDGNISEIGVNLFSKIDTTQTLTLTETLFSASVVATENYAIAIGGSHSGTKDIFVGDLNAKTWTKHTNVLPAALTNSFSCIVGNSVWTLKDTNVYIADIDNLSSWTTVPTDLPASSNSYEVGNLVNDGDKVYYLHSGDLYWCNVSDPSTWTKITTNIPFSTGSSTYSAQSENELIFVYTSLGRSPEIFTAFKDKPSIWTLRATLPASNYIAGAVMNGEIWLSGGFTSSSENTGRDLHRASLKDLDTWQRQQNVIPKGKTLHSLIPVPARSEIWWFTGDTTGNYRSNTIYVNKINSSFFSAAQIKNENNVPTPVELTTADQLQIFYDIELIIHMPEVLTINGVTNTYHTHDQISIPEIGGLDPSNNPLVVGSATVDAYATLLPLSDTKMRNFITDNILSGGAAGNTRITAYNGQDPKGITGTINDATGFLNATVTYHDNTGSDGVTTTVTSILDDGSHTIRGKSTFGTTKANDISWTDGNATQHDGIEFLYSHPSSSAAANQQIAQVRFVVDPPIMKESVHTLDFDYEIEFSWSRK